MRASVLVVAIFVTCIYAASIEFLHGRYVTTGQPSMENRGDGSARQYYVQMESVASSITAWNRLEAIIGTKPPFFLDQNTFLVWTTGDIAQQIAGWRDVLWIDALTGFNAHPFLTAANLPSICDSNEVHLRINVHPQSNVDPAVTISKLSIAPLRIFYSADDHLAFAVSCADFVAVIAELQNIAEVYWVEQYSPPTECNKYASWETQSGQDDVRSTWTMGLTGANQMIAVIDAGLNQNSCYFPAGKVKYQCMNSAGCTTTNPHGTHIAATVAGQVPTASAAASLWNGMAPDANITFYDVTDGTNRGLTNINLAALLNSAIQSQSYIATMAFVTPVKNGYDQYAFDVDTVSQQNPNFLGICAAGNYGPVSESVRSPGSSKNCLAVGSASATYASWQRLGQSTTQTQPQGLEVVASLTSPQGFIGSTQTQQLLLASFSASVYPSLSVQGAIVITVTNCRPSAAFAASYANKLIVAQVGATKADHYSSCAYNLASALQGYNAAAVVIMDSVSGSMAWLLKIGLAQLNIPVMTASHSAGVKFVQSTMLKNVQVTYEFTASANTGNLADSSSRGPTMDDRYKPDVVAPGEWIWSASSSAQCQAVAMYGTSQATAVVAGAAALVRQYFVDGYYPTMLKNPQDSMIPSGALIKAMLIHSGNGLAGTALDPTGKKRVQPLSANQQGYFGSVLLDNVLQTSLSNYNLEVQQYTITNGESKSYCFMVDTDSSVPFRVTLVWMDIAASQQAKKALINNIDLLVSGPSGDVKGNSRYNNGGQAYDQINNVETVEIPATPGNSGQYLVMVIGRKISTAGQQFALVLTGTFQNRCDGADISSIVPVSAVLNAQPLVTITGLRLFNPAKQLGPNVYLAGFPAIVTQRIQGKGDSQQLVVQAAPGQTNFESTLTGSVTIISTSRMFIFKPALFTYVAPAQIYGFTPQQGTSVGGVLVTINGINFALDTQVSFGVDTAAQRVSLTSTQIVVKTPPMPYYGWRINVESPTIGNTFATWYTSVSTTTMTITPAQGGFSGQVVTLLGNNILSSTSDVVTITFGANEVIASSIQPVTTSQIVCTAPTATVAGSVTILLMSQSATTELKNGFTYIAPVTPCLGLQVLSAVSGTFSPGYTSLPRHAFTCQWLIQSFSASSIKVSITGTNMVGGDSLRISPSNTLIGYPLKLIQALFSGSSTSAFTLVTFSATASTTLRTGFTAKFTAICKDVPCTPSSSTNGVDSVEDNVLMLSDTLLSLDGVAVPQCDGDVTYLDGNDTISGGYSNSACQITVQPIAGAQQINLMFTSFVIAPQDQLLLYAATDDSLTSQLLATFTMAQPPPAMFVATSPAIYVLWQPSSVTTSYNGWSFYFNCALGPVIQSLSPAVGSTFGGTTTTIYGMNLGNGQDITKVLFNNIAATVLSQSETSIVVLTGSGSPINVTTNATVSISSLSQGNYTAVDLFTLSAPGVINSVTPVYGTVNMQITISGEGLGSGTDITAVTIGGVACSPIFFQNETDVVVLAGPAAAPGIADVLVMSTSRGTATAQAAFTYAPTPCAGGCAFISGTCSVCPQGTFAADGAVVCSPCPANTYSNVDGAGSCTPCPSSGFTGTVGAINATQCITAESGSINAGVMMHYVVNSTWLFRTFTIAQTADQLVLQMQLGAGAAAAMYSQFGSPPSVTQYDSVVLSNNGSSMLQRVIAPAAAGTYYVGVQVIASGSIAVFASLPAPVNVLAIVFGTLSAILLGTVVVLTVKYRRVVMASQTGTPLARPLMDPL